MIRGENLLVLLTAIAGSLSLYVICGTQIPLGVPGEWIWPRHILPEQPAEWIGRLVPVAIAGCLLIGVARLFEPDQLGLRTLWSKYFVLLIAGWIWFDCLQTTAPPTHNNLKPSWVTYDPSISGYFDKAAFEIDNTQEFLANYESMMAKGDVLHVGTHPPGMFLLCRWAIETCEAVPAIGTFVQSVLPEDREETFRNLEQHVTDLKPRRLTESEVNALGLIQLVLQLSALLVIFPLAWLVSSISNEIAAWRACCLVVALPSIAVFFPKSDVAFPLIALTGITFGWKAMNAERASRRFIGAVLSGTTFWCGLLISLAHIPAGGVLLVCGIIRSIRQRKEHLIGDLVTGFIIVGTILAMTMTWNALTECNLWSVWTWNFKNHAEFYSQFVRTWWKWLLANPIELALAAGLPVTALAFFGLFKSIKPAHDQLISENENHTLSHALALVIAALWLSGKNSGEAARLWCFLLPWLIVMANPILSVIRPATAIRLLALQLLVCIGTIMSVSGFESITEQRPPNAQQALDQQTGQQHAYQKRA